ncbi:MAG: hypothetical protein ACU0BN_02505 [Sulfitobacter sp.]
MAEKKYNVSKALRAQLLELGHAAIDAGDMMVANNIVALLLEVAPSWPQWLELKATVSLKCGLIEQAEQELKSCLARFPGSANALTGLFELALSNQEYERVLSLTETYEIHGKHAPFIVAACDKIAGSGNADLALSGLMHLVEMKHEDVDLYIRSSRLAIAAGKLDLNTIILSTLRELRPQNVYGHLEQVHKLTSQGRTFEARDALEKLDARFPNSPVILSNLSEIAIDLYDGSRALELIQKLEGSLPGRRLRDMQIRAHACASDWVEVLRLCDGVGVHSTAKDKTLSAYANIYLGNYEAALSLIQNVEKESGNKKSDRWLPVARQVANFGKKAKILADDPAYRYVGGQPTMEPVNKVQMLWVGGNLTPFERLSISSWLYHGFGVDLYTYGKVDHAPEGCVLRDASEIMSKDRIFAHSAQTGRSKGSFAGFADVFRWHLLRKRGGFWADCDIVCLKSFELPSNLAIASEIARTFGADHMAVTNCFYGGPAGHPMFEAACQNLDDYNPETLGWGEVGTQLIGKMVDEHNLESFVLRPDTFNAISPYRMISMMRSTDMGAFETLTANSWGLHMYNEVWRSHQISKFGPFPRNSVIHHLFARFDIEVDITPELPTFQFKDDLIEASTEMSEAETNFQTSRKDGSHN